MNILEHFFEVIVAFELLLLVVNSTNIYDSTSFTRKSIDPYELIKILPKVYCSKLSSEIESCVHNNKKYVLNKMMQRPKSFDVTPFEDRSVTEDSDEYETMVTDTSKFEIKRNSNPAFDVNCGCKYEINYPYLGNEYYPPYIRNITCGQSQGMNGKPMRRIRCLPIHYPVKVLARRMENEGDNDYTSMLPIELRRRWKFELFHLVAGCKCGH